MLLDSQIKFAADYIKPLSQDKKVKLPAGYKEKFEKWLRESGIKTYQKTHEDLAKMFAYFLEKEIKADILDTIDKLKAPKEEKAKLKALAARGQVLLASRDGGKTFNRLITLEDLKAVKAKDFVLLTPTMQTETTDLAEVIHHQTVFHIISKFAQSGILATYEGMEGDDIIVSTSHPKFGQDTIRVNTAGDISQPLKFRSEKTGREFFETQMPEVYGTTQPDPSLQPLSKEEVAILALSGRGVDPTQHAGAFAATAAAAEAVNAVNKASQAAMLNALNQAQIQKLLGKKAEGMSLVNVIAARARMARQRNEGRERQELSAQRVENFIKAERELIRERRAKEEEAKERRKQRRKQRMKRIAIASAAAGGLATTGGATAMFINNLNINIFT